MDRRTSWRHEGGKFHGQRSNSLSWSQPLLGIEPDDGESKENVKRVHWSPSTTSLNGRGSDIAPISAEGPPQTGYGGEFVKSMVYGGLDAIVTSFALVASVSGSGIGSGAVLVLGFANLIADGISMGFGDYLSTSAEQAYAANEQKTAEWDVEQDLQAEATNMVELYESKYTMERSDAEEVVKIFSKYRDLLADQRMALQAGLVPPGGEEDAWKNGLVTFISFLCFGCTPLLSFVVLDPITKNVHVKFAGACVVTALTLVLLGIAKARTSGEKSFGSVLTVLSNGGLAAAAAYGISWSLNNLLGISEP